MRVATMFSGTADEYTAFIPEGVLDRWALRRLARAPGFEFAIVGALELRDSVARRAVDRPGRPWGTTLVRKRGA